MSASRSIGVVAVGLAVACGACGGRVSGPSEGPNDGGAGVGQGNPPPGAGLPGTPGLPPASGADASFVGSACVSPSIMVLTGPPSWPCLKEVCGTTLLDCANDCTCNDAVAQALSCAGAGGTNDTTTCFTTALTPVIIDPAVEPLVMCLEDVSPMCATSAGEAGVADSGPVDSPDATGCIPYTCATAGANCGGVADGCGGIVSCGTCVAPQFCGGGGYARCGGPVVLEAGPCISKTCSSSSAVCGLQGDDCGGVLDCGPCDAGPG